MSVNSYAFTLRIKYDKNHFQKNDNLCIINFPSISSLVQNFISFYSSMHGFFEEETTKNIKYCYACVCKYIFVTWTNGLISYVVIFTIISSSDYYLCICVTWIRWLQVFMEEPFSKSLVVQKKRNPGSGRSIFSVWSLISAFNLCLLKICLSKKDMSWNRNMYKRIFAWFCTKKIV